MQQRKSAVGLVMSHVFKRFGERLCLLEGLGILPGGIGIGNDAGAHLDMGDAVLDDGVS